jgi:hypothetical protein
MQHGRIFMSHLGLILPKNVERITCLDPQLQFWKRLVKLDAIPERYTLSTGVLFIGENQRSLKQIYGGTTVSSDFQEFILSLGWLVQLQHHNGYTGGFEEKRVEVHAVPYYSSG